MRSVVITGAPGCGKSTVCQWLTSNYQSFYGVVGLGEAIHSVLGDKLSREDVRRNAVELVTPSVLKAGCQELSRRAKVVAASCEVVLIEWRDVTQTNWGFMVTPLAKDALQDIELELIVDLVVPYKSILARAGGRGIGHIFPSEAENSTHANLQTIVANILASDVGCPLFVVDSSASIERVGNSIDDLIRGQLSYPRKP